MDHIIHDDVLVGYPNLAETIVTEGGLRIVRVRRDRGPGLVWSPWGVLRHMVIASTFVMPLRWTYQFVFLCERHDHCSLSEG